MFAEPVVVVRRRRGPVRLMPVAGQQRRRGVMINTLAVGAGEQVEVRP